MTTDPLLLLLDDARSVRYRPSLARALGGALPAVLLQHLLARWDAAGRNAFLAFDVPGDDARCPPGDSLAEALGFAPEELEHARDALAAGGPEGPLLRHWTDDDGAPWYDLDAAALRALLGRALPPTAGSALPRPRSTEGLLRRHLGRLYEAMLGERPERRRAWLALPPETVEAAARTAQGMAGHFVTRLRERLDELGGLEPERKAPRGTAPEPGPPEAETTDGSFEAEADPVALARFLARAAPELRETTLSRLGEALRARVEEEFAALEERRREEAQEREEASRTQRQRQTDALLRSLAARMDLGAALPDDEDAAPDRLLEALVDPGEDAP